MKKTCSITVVGVFVLMLLASSFGMLNEQKVRGETDGIVNMGDESPGPIMSKPAEVDLDNNGISDVLDNEIALKIADGSGQDYVNATVMLKSLPTDSDLRAFVSTGGYVVTPLWTKTIYGFGGRIQYDRIERFVEQCPNVMLIEKNGICKCDIAYAARQTGARSYVWNTLGLRGDPSSSIAILDSGIDALHPDFSPGYGDQDFSRKIVGWHDELDGTTFPTDDSDHGTHCAGLAAGGGFFSHNGGNAIATSEQYIEDPGEQGAISHWETANVMVNATGTITVRLQWANRLGGTASLQGIALFDGRKTLDSSQWVLLGNWLATPDPDVWYTLTFNVATPPQGGYDMYHVMFQWVGGTGEIVIGTTISWPYTPPSDGFPAWTGIAPEAKLVGVRAFNAQGAGNFWDIFHGNEWIATNCQLYHITVVSMSFSAVAPDEQSGLRLSVFNLINHGITVVAAAGNGWSGSNNIYAPGSVDEAITVAAMNQFDDIACYSSEGGLGYHNTQKPDIVAPGGSVFASSILSADSTLHDGYGEWPDFQVNDANAKEGTSMATPIVAGAANILIEAMGGYSNWQWTKAQAMKPKMILLMTATETYPKLREGDTEGAHSPTPDRGGKDVHEGYGRINLDAAVDAVAQTYNVGDVVNGALGRPPTLMDITTVGQHLAWARKVSLTSGTTCKFNMTVPSGADFDLYLYSGTGDGFGEPIILNSSTTVGTGGIESIEVVPPATGTYYLVVKRATETTDAGQFTLTSFVKHTGEVTLYPNGDHSVALLTYGGSGTHYSCVNEYVIDNNTSYVYSPTDGDTYQDDFDIDNYAFSREVAIDSVTITGWIRSCNWICRADFRIFLDTGTGKLYSAHAYPGTTYESKTLEIFGLTPSTLNSSRMGVEITAGFNMKRMLWHAGRCTQLYMVVDYSYWDTS